MGSRTTDTVTIPNVLEVETTGRNVEHTKGVIFPVMVGGKSGTAFVSLTDMALADPDATLLPTASKHKGRENPYGAVPANSVRRIGARDMEMAQDAILPVHISGPASDTIRETDRYDASACDRTVVCVDNAYGERMSAVSRGATETFVTAADLALLASSGRELGHLMDQELDASHRIREERPKYGSETFVRMWEVVEGDQTHMPSLDPRVSIHTNNIIAIQEMTGLCDRRFLPRRDNPSYFGTYQSEPLVGKSHDLTDHVDVARARGAAHRRVKTRLPMSCEMSDIACSPDDPQTPISQTRELDEDALTIPVSAANPVGLQWLSYVGTFETHMDWPVSGQGTHVQAKMVPATIAIDGLELPCNIVYDSAITRTERIVSGHPMGNEYEYTDTISDPLSIGHLPGDGTPRAALAPNTSYIVLVGVMDDETSAVRRVEAMPKPKGDGKGSEQSRKIQLAQEALGKRGTDDHMRWVATELSSTQLAELVVEPLSQMESTGPQADATEPTPRARDTSDQRTPIAAPDWDESTPEAQIDI